MLQAWRDTGVSLLAILLVGVLLRAGAVLLLKTYQGDSAAYEHAEIARSLAAGHGFRIRFFSETPQDTSQQAPAVPYTLSVAYRVLGIETPAAHLAYQFFNIALAAAGTIGLYLSGSILWDRTAGLWAAALYAVYPPLIYTVTRIQAVNWAVAFLLMLIGCGVAARRFWCAGWAAGAGVVAGLGILAEPIMAAAFGLTCLGLIVAALREERVSRRRAVTVVAMMVLAATAVVSPWILRNIRVHGQLVFVKSTFWYVFWQGNNLSASGTDKLEISPELQRKLGWRLGAAGLENEVAQARHQSVSIDSVLTPAQLVEIRSRPTETERVGWFREESLRVLRGNPGHYLRMCRRRLVQLLWFDPTNPRALTLSYRLPYLVLAALFAVGLWLCRRRPPKWWVPAVLAPLGLFSVHVLVITSARFRLPMEAAMLLPAGLGVSQIMAWLERRPRAGSEFGH